ncbi:MAG: hypothetical protein GY753_09910 [Gammaproteobacteria bacterium]|nr:hypothetical protein [Gammaproteobacteria bacterium]
MARPKTPNLTAHLAPSGRKKKVPRSPEQIAEEITRQKLDLIKDARELGRELGEVWDEQA